MDHFSVAFTGPQSSMASPRTLNIRPRTPSPTGTEMGAPVAVTHMPRPRPSLGESMMQRTVSPPTCWATSITWRLPSSSTSRASLSSGRSPSGKATSTTGPMTCTMVPLFSCIVRKIPFRAWIAPQSRRLTGRRKSQRHSCFAPEPAGTSSRPDHSAAWAPPTTSVISWVMADCRARL